MAAFWKWFQEVAPRFYATIEAGKCGTLTEETSSRVNELSDGLGWVYGPGAGGKGHSLTVTGEGNIHRQLLTLRWLEMAPAIEGWTFYAARQPGEIKGHVMGMFDQRFDPKEIWVSASVNESDEKIDLTVWHPAWEKLENRQKFTVTFLFLDEALGEYGTDWWIGEINHGKDKLAASFPLEELAAHVTATARQHGWKKHAPGELWTNYSVKQQTDAFPRGDIFTLTTAVPRLFLGYMDADGELEDPLAGSGADYVYVSIARGHFPEGGEIDRRSQIEDAMEAALRKFSGGRSIGGAMGRERGYIDLLIYDGQRSLDAMQQALRAQKVPPGTMIEFFAREKRGQRIAL
ncbi:MAG TPA: hypothetical protein VG734_21830 [Lacunisphaera sp.]|nr:hypothetical protein [Lacunisphaera sp.]